MNFFESSLWMTAALLVLAIVARGLHQRRAGAAVAPTWLSAAVAYVAASRVGRVCLRQNYLVERVRIRNNAALPIRKFMCI